MREKEVPSCMWRKRAKKCSQTRHEKFLNTFVRFFSSFIKIKTISCTLISREKKLRKHILKYTRNRLREKYRLENRVYFYIILIFLVNYAHSFCSFLFLLLLIFLFVNFDRAAPNQHHWAPFVFFMLPVEIWNFARKHSCLYFITFFLRTITECNKK